MEIICVGVVIFIALGIVYILLWYFDIKLFYNKRLERIIKKGKELSKGKSGLYIVSSSLGEYCFEFGRQVSRSFPVYKNPQGRYYSYDMSDCEYVGYCDKGKLNRKKAKDGVYGVFDKKGNRRGATSIAHNRNNDESSSYSSNSGNTYYEEENRQEINHRVDWRPDGSYGDIYDNGYQQTDQWGNPLY